MVVAELSLEPGRVQATHLRERHPSSERRSDFMTVPEPETNPESDDGEVDPYAELGVETTSSGANISDGLEAFMDDEDEDEPVASAPVVIEHQEDDDDDDDDDLYAALGVAGPSVALASSGEDDILAAFMDDDDEEEEANEDTAEAQEPSTTPQNDGIEAYRMVLETVWVDGILDPGEVHLLAKRREALGISFEEHLELVREMLG